MIAPGEYPTHPQCLPSLLGMFSRWKSREWLLHSGLILMQVDDLPA